MLSTVSAKFHCLTVLRQHAASYQQPPVQDDPVTLPRQQAVSVRQLANVAGAL